MRHAFWFPFFVAVYLAAAVAMHASAGALPGPQGGGAQGDVSGPGSSTDNEIPSFDGAAGDTLQGTGITYASGVLTFNEGDDLVLPTSGTDAEVSAFDSSGPVIQLAQQGGNSRFNLELANGDMTVNGGFGWRAGAAVGALGTPYGYIWTWGAADGRAYLSNGANTDWAGLDADFWGCGDKDSFGDSEVFLSSRTSTSRTMLVSQSKAESLTDGLYVEIGETADEARIGTADSDDDPLYLAIQSTDVAMVSTQGVTALDGAALAIGSSTVPQVRRWAQSAVTVTDGSAYTIATIDLPATDDIHGSATVHYTATADDGGGNFQVERGAVSFAYHVTSSGTSATGAATTYGVADDLDTGTLSVSGTVTNSSEDAVLQLTVDTSYSPSTCTLAYTIEVHGYHGVTLP